jgi:conjugal transfer ATP-binding protein TraC
MLSFVQAIGKKITSLLGESVGTSDFGASDHKTNNSCFSGVPLSSFLPYEIYDEDSGLFINKKSLGFAIEMLPLIGSDHTAQKNIDSLFDEIFEEGDSIQCLLWTDHRIDSLLDFWEEPRKKMGGVYAKIASKRVESFKNNKQFHPALFRFVFSYTIPFEGAIESNAHLIQKLKVKKEKCVRILRSMSTSARFWQPIDLLDVVGGLVNFSNATKALTPAWNPYQSLASQIPRGSRIEIQKGKLIGKNNPEIAFKSFRVVDFPDYWSLIQMQHLIGDVERDSFRLTCPFYIHYCVHCPNQSLVGQKFKMREKFVEKQGQSSMFLKMIPQLKDELKEIQYARKELHQGARFVWTNLSVGIWSHPQEIIQSEEILKGIFRNNRFTLVENEAFPLAAFLSALPMSLTEQVKGLKSLNFFRTTLNRECGNYVPMQGEWYGTLKSPGVLLLGRRGQLTNWNAYDNEYGNYNIAVIGKSGSGKSVFMQELIFNVLGTGSKVFVLDVGRSFDKLCHTLDGQCIEFSRESTICLNPFTKFPLNNISELNEGIILLKSIIANMADPINGMSSEQNSLIEEAIKEVWKVKQCDSSITGISDWLKRHEDQQARSIGRMLYPYTIHGVFGHYFEGKNNVDFTNPFVLIELEELKEKKDLQTVVLQILMLTITDQAFLGDRKTRFSICVDEAWDLFKAKQTGPFIETLARRLRKYNGSLIVGTQRLEDFESSPGAQAAYANSDWVCFLPQHENSIEIIKKEAKMPEAKIKALQSLKTVHGVFSELMICQGQSYTTHRLFFDPFSNLLYSTQPADYGRIHDLRKQGMSLENTIEAILKERACTR